jgi:hypothetical protein
MALYFFAGRGAPIIAPGENLSPGDGKGQRPSFANPAFRLAA